MVKRKRIARIGATSTKVKAIELLSEQFEVDYQRAFTAYLSAKKYCNIFKDKTVLEETEYILLMYKTKHLVSV